MNLASNSKQLRARAEPNAQLANDFGEQRRDAAIRRLEDRRHLEERPYARRRQSAKIAREPPPHNTAD